MKMDYPLGPTQLPLAITLHMRRDLETRLCQGGTKIIIVFHFNLNSHTWLEPPYQTAQP